jgi:hypothetical protein
MPQIISLAQRFRVLNFAGSVWALRTRMASHGVHEQEVIEI